MRLRKPDVRVLAIIKDKKRLVVIEGRTVTNEEVRLELTRIQTVWLIESLLDALEALGR